MCTVRSREIAIYICRIRGPILCFTLCLQNVVIASLMCEALAERTCLGLILLVKLMIAEYFLSASDQLVS